MLSACVPGTRRSRSENMIELVFGDDEGSPERFVSRDQRSRRRGSACRARRAPAENAIRAALALSRRTKPAIHRRTTAAPPAASAAGRQRGHLFRQILVAEPFHLLRSEPGTATVLHEGRRRGRPGRRARSSCPRLPLGRAIVGIHEVRIVLADGQYQAHILLGGSVHGRLGRLQGICRTRSAGPAQHIVDSAKRIEANHCQHESSFLLSARLLSHTRRVCSSWASSTRQSCSSCRSASISSSLSWRRGSPTFLALCAAGNRRLGRRRGRHFLAGAESRRGRAQAAGAALHPEKGGAAGHPAARPFTVAALGLIPPPFPYTAFVLVSGAAA